MLCNARRYTQGLKQARTDQQPLTCGTVAHVASPPAVSCTVHLVDGRVLTLTLASRLDDVIGSRPLYLARHAGIGAADG